jgi:hypothetical protein
VGGTGVSLGSGEGVNVAVGCGVDVLVGNGVNVKVAVGVEVGGANKDTLHPIMDRATRMVTVSLNVCFIFTSPLYLCSMGIIQYPRACFAGAAGR